MNKDEENNYKVSNYNYMIDYNNKKLFFNGITGAGFCMTRQEYDIVYSLLSDLQFFRKKHLQDFNRLRDLGYIVENDFDEMAYLEYRNRESVFLNRAYRIIINPTLDCNFNCWYCYEKHPKDRMSNEIIERIKRHIHNKIENKEITSLALSWFGGEPLLYFRKIMQPILEYAKTLCESKNLPFSSDITTNAYCMNKDMIETFNEIRLTTFQITLDGDRNRHNKIRNMQGSPSYDKIIENVNLLCEKVQDANILLRINYDNQTLKDGSVLDILSDIAEQNRDKIRFDLHRVWQTTKITNSDVENNDVSSFIKAAKQAGYRYVSNAGSLSIGQYHNCYASRYHYVLLNYDGKVYKCTARDFTKDNAFGELTEDGHIEWDTKKISKYLAVSTFENPMCLKCKYLPLCWGPCPQKIFELSDDNFEQLCPLKYAERSMDDKIIDVYESSLRNKKMIKDDVC